MHGTNVKKENLLTPLEMKKNALRVLTVYNATVIRL